MKNQVTRFLLAAALLPSPAAAATHTWIGGTPANIQWTNGVQWQAGNAPNPVNGADDLVFGAVAAAYLTNSNDFAADTDFNSLAFSSPGYVISGNPFDVTAGINSTHAAAGLTVLNPAITLLANQQWQVSGSAGGVLTLNGLVKLSGNQLQVGGIGTTRALAGFAGTQANSRLVKNGSGTLVVGADSSVVGTTTINNGTVILNGSLADSAVTVAGASAKLGGEQSVTVNSLTITAGEVRPGYTESLLESGRRLTVSNGLAMNSAAAAYVCSLGGLTAGSQHDQIRVTGGTVNLTGAALTVSLDAGYTPLGGDQFTILEVPGASAITGTFAGKAEGSTFTAGSSTFRINYAAGDGNDVVLSAVAPATGNTRTWTGLGPDASWSRAGNWSANTLPVPGDALVFPAGAARPVNVNDLSPGRTYQSITFGAGGYSISGTGIALNAGITATTNASAVTLATPVRVLANQSWTLNTGGGASVLDLTTAATVEVLPGVVLTVNPTAAASAIALHGIISGDGGLLKDGSGIVSLDAANTYRGPTTVVRGMLSAENCQALGANSSGTTVDGVSGPVLKFAVNNMTVTEPLTIGSGTLQTGLSSCIVNAPVAFTNAATSIVETLFVTTNLTLNGIISGAGTLNKTGAGTLTSAGPADNTLSTIWVKDGIFAFSKATPQSGTVPFTLKIGDSTGANGSAFFQANQTILNYFTGSLEVAADGQVDITSGTLGMDSVSITGDEVKVLSSTGLGKLGFDALNVTSQTSGDQPVKITCDLYIGEGTSVINAAGNASSDLLIQGAMSWAVSGAALVFNGPEMMQMDGSAISAGSLPFNISGGIVYVTADYTRLEVTFSGLNPSLRGDGTVGSISGPGLTEPGFTLPAMSCGNYSAGPGAIFQPGIIGPALSQIERLDVNGTVSVSGAQLAVGSSSYMPLHDEEHVILNNDGTDPVTGTFSGLAEGATVTAGGRPYRITYAGGDGNDIALYGVVTATGVTRVWDGGGGTSVWTNHFNWAGDVTPVPGDTLNFPETAARKINVNDFPAGSAFAALNFTGGGYSISGSEVVVLQQLTHAAPSGNGPVLSLPLRAGLDACSFSINSGAQDDMSFTGGLNLGGRSVVLSNAIPAGGAVLSVAGGISGSGSLTKSGIGQVTFSNTSAATFTGPLTVQQGRLFVTDNATLGATGPNNATTVNAGAVLWLAPAGSPVLGESFNLAGTLVNTGAFTLSGRIDTTAATGRVNPQTAADSLNCTGVIGGAFPFVKSGTGTVTLNGSSAWTAPGLTVAEGPLWAGKTNAGAINGPVVVGDGTGAANSAVLLLTGGEQFQSAAAVSVRPDGVLDLSENDQTVSGGLTLEAGRVISSGGTLKLGGPVTTVAAASSSEIAGLMELTANTAWAIADGAAAADLKITGGLTAASRYRITKSGAGRLDWLAASSAPFDLLATAGTLNVNSVCPQLNYLGENGAVLSGTGSAGFISPSFNSPALLSPNGGAPGVVTTVGFYSGTGNPAGTYRVQINGATAGTGYDQMITASAPGLGNGVLEVETGTSYAPVFGEEFIIIDNQDTDPVHGMFGNAPTGTLFTINGKQLEISYTGGDGNDVVLTCITPSGTVRTWTGGGANGNWTTAANWGGTAPMAGDRLLFPEGAARLTNTNNFIAGTVFEQIRFSGGGYSISGNRVALIAGIAVDSITDPVNFSASVELTQSQNWSFSNAANYPFTLSGAVNLGAFMLGFNKAGGPVISGSISGTGGLTVAGGPVTLGGNSTYSGPTTVNAGKTVRLLHNNALGASGIGTTLKEGATVEGATTPLTIAEQFNSEGGTLRSLANPVIFSGAVNLATGTTTAAVPGAPHVLNATGAWSGPGTLSKTGSGTLSFTGTAANALTGPAVVVGGTLSLGRTAGGAPLGGDVTIEGGAAIVLTAAQQMAAAGVTPGVKIRSGGTLNLNGFTQTIGRLILTGGTVNTGSATGDLVSDRITVEADSDPSSITGSGTVSAIAGADFIVADGPASPDLNVTAVISSRLSGDVTKTGPGSVQFSAANTVAGIRAEEGESIFSAVSNSTVTLKDAIVSGTGKVAALTLDSAAASAVIRPGSSPGRLTVNSLTAAAVPAGTLEIEIAGAAAGTQFDQIQIDASAAPDPLDLSGLNLSVSLTGGFLPALNSTFRIVENLSTDTTINTFRGLAQGATVNTGRVNFTISYTGGDVVLTAASYNGSDRTWTGAGANNLWSTAANWQGGVAPLAGDRLIFPAAGARKTSVNDFPAETVFTSLTFSSGAYNISGAVVRIADSLAFDHTSGAAVFSLPIQSIGHDLSITLPAAPASADLSGGIYKPGYALLISGNGTVSGVISGAYGFVIYEGGGTLTLSAANTFGDSCQIMGGTLVAAHPQALGSSLRGTGISNPAATLKLAASAITEDVSLAGTLRVDNGTASLIGEVSLNGASLVEVASGAELTINGRIQDSRLRKTGAGSLVLTSSHNSAYSARGLTIDQGTVVAAYPSSGEISGITTIGDGNGFAGTARLVLAGNEQLNSGVPLTINSDGSLELGDFAQTLSGNVTLDEGRITGTTGVLSLSGPLATVAGANPSEIAGLLHLAAPATWTIPDGTAPADLIVTAEVTADSSPRLTKAGAGRLDWLSNSTSDYELSATAGTLQFAGDHPDVRVFGSGGATIGGTGTFARINAKDGTAATLLPGNASPGLIETNSLYFGPVAPGGTLRVQLNGPAPGTGYDQITVLPSAITNAVRLDNATLEVVTNTGYQPGFGQVFTIIDNQTADTAIGTFAGLAEGATFTVNGRQVQLSYAGGDGNDVTLTGSTLSGTLRTWTGGGTDNNWTTAANWGGTAPVAGDRLLFPEGAARTTNVNNFTAGTPFDSISFDGTAYNISGNAIALVNGFSVHQLSGPVTFAPAVTLTQSQNWTTDSGAFGLNCTGAVSLGGFDLGLTGPGGKIVVAGVVSGTGGLTVGDDVVASLLGNNTFSGAVSVLTGGEVWLGHASALGAAATGTTLAADSEIHFNVTGVVAEPVTSLGATIEASVAGGGSLSGNLTLASGTTTLLSFQTTHALTCSGRISGPGTLVKSGPGTLTLSGASGNDHFFTTVAGGTLLLNKTGGAVALMNSVIVTGSESPAVVRLLTAGQFHSGATSLSLGTGSTLDLNGLATVIPSLALTGASVLTGTAAGDLLTGDLAVMESETASTIAGPGKVRTGTTRTWTIADGSAAPDLHVSARIEGAAGELIKAGPGTLRSTGDNIIPLLRLTEGEFIAGGSSPFTTTVVDGGTLSGTGLLGLVTTAVPGQDATSLITPGASPGRLSVNSLRASAGNTAELKIEIEGLTAAAEYDQIQIEAPGTEVDLSGLTLTLRLNGYLPPLGSTFRIIENLSPVTAIGTFAGLPQGATINSGGVQFTVSYTGGDVVLTAGSYVGNNRTWTGLGADNNWSTAANWQGGNVPSTGDRLIFPAGAARTTNVNDLPADTVFGTLTISSSAYSISGNRAGILNGITVNHPAGIMTCALPVRLFDDLTLSMPAVNLCQWNGAIELNGHKLTTAGRGNLDGVISGSGRLEKTGSVFLFIGGTNTYTGVTTILDGTLVLSNTAGLGSFSTGTAIATGAALQIQTSGTVHEPVALFGGLVSTGAGRILAGAVQVNETASINCSGAGAQITLTGQINGTGHLTIRGSGTTTFSGSLHGDFSGASTITEGTVILGKTLTAGNPALGSSITVSSNTSATLRIAFFENQLAPDTMLTIGTGGILDLNAQDEIIAALNLSGGTVLTTGSAGRLTVNDLFVSASDNTSTIAGPGSIHRTTDGEWSIEDGAASPDLSVTARITANGESGLTKTGAGALVSTAANTIRNFAIAEGSARFDGLSTDTAVLVQGGTLMGSGQLRRVAVDENSLTARIAPGASAGLLHANTLLFPASAEGVLEIELGGASPGSGFDQFQVESSSINNSINLAGAALDLKLIGGFTPAVGANFRIINNLDGDASTGTFLGQPEASTFTAGGFSWSITYTGGDGNDVVVTRINPSGVPAPAVVNFTNAFSPDAGGAGVPGRTIAFTGQGQSGQPYKLQGSRNLTTWVDLATATANGSGVVTFNFTDTANLPRRMYRVVVP